jgi:hypothetical protein
MTKGSAPPLSALFAKEERKSSASAAAAGGTAETSSDNLTVATADSIEASKGKAPTKRGGRKPQKPLGSLLDAMNESSRDMDLPPEPMDVHTVDSRDLLVTGGVKKKIAGDRPKRRPRRSDERPLDAV